MKKYNSIYVTDITLTKKHFMKISIMLIVICLTTGVLFSQIPKTLSYQGILTDSEGKALDKNVEMTFKLYTESDGGTAVWEETQDIDILNDGIFNVLLGKYSPLDISFDKALWLGITIGSDDPELKPRTPLTASPYSLGKQNGIGPDLELESLRVVSPVKKTIYAESEDSVAIHAVAKDTFAIVGHSTDHVGVYGKSDTAAYAGVLGEAPEIGTMGISNRFGVYGTSKGSAPWAGVYGTADNAVGVKGVSIASDGVRGVTKNINSSGVYGESGAGTGLKGRSNGGTGVVGESSTGLGVSGYSPTNFGVFGVTDAAGFAGVYGQSIAGIGSHGQSNTNYGVYGSTLAAAPFAGVYGFSGTAWGIAGLSNGDHGVYGQTTIGAPAAGVHGQGVDMGVEGIVTALNGIGVRGIGGGNGIGVNGIEVNGIGVAGTSTNSAGVIGNTTNGAGVMGNAGAGNGSVGVMGNDLGAGTWAGFFNGDVNAGNRLKVGIVPVAPFLSPILVWGPGGWIQQMPLQDMLNEIPMEFGIPFKIKDDKGVWFEIDSTGNSFHRGFETFEKGLESWGEGEQEAIIGLAQYGTAIRGESSGMGVHGESHSDQPGVFGTSNNGVGVQGEGSSSTGVVGITTDENYAGVTGFSETGHGVYGNALNGYGVIANSENHIGLRASGQDIAGYFEGDVLIEQDGKLKIDNVQPTNETRVLIWANDKYVKHCAFQDLLGEDIFKAPVIITNSGDEEIFTLDDYGNSSQTGQSTVTGGLLVPTLSDGTITLDPNDGFRITNTENIVLQYDTQGNSYQQGYAEFGTGMFVDGDIETSGSIIATNKYFRVDHPLYPEKMYLKHVAIESDEMKNIYDGVVELNANGKAQIELPEWFEALNTSFRYQLTCIGGFAPVYISKEISQNRFEIAGGQKGLKVSWQVSGTRHDKWALENPIVVEELKNK